MKTEYVQTDFPKITKECRRAFEIRGRARGVKLVPLAKGEKPPTEKASRKPRGRGKAAASKSTNAANSPKADKAAQTSESSKGE